MIRKKTVDLQPGDVVDWDDHLDKVVSVTISKDEKSVHVDTIRTFLDSRGQTPVESSFDAGILSEQDVAEFCPGCGSMDTDTNPVEGGECPVCIFQRVQQGGTPV
jgi:hypothetical protein